VVVILLYRCDKPRDINTRCAFQGNLTSKIMEVFSEITLSSARTLIPGSLARVPTYINRHARAMQYMHKTQANILNTLGFHGGDYEECSLLVCDDVWLL
jgi:hypothetical protein